MDGPAQRDGAMGFRAGCRGGGGKGAEQGTGTRGAMLGFETFPPQQDMIRKASLQAQFSPELFSVPTVLPILGPFCQASRNLFGSELHN